MIELKNQERGFGKSKLGELTQGFISNLAAIKYIEEYEKKKLKALNKLKGGNNMETKSRYEVIAELEEKKRNLIINRDNLPGQLQEKKKELRDMKRRVEDEEEEIKEFEAAIEQQKETINELIRSVDESLSRFAELGKKS